MPDISQAIAIRSVVAHELEFVQRFLTEARNTAHILTPFARSNVPMIPDGWDVYFHQYKISTEVAKDTEGKPYYKDGEIYAIRGTGRVALTKVGLWRLEQLAGVSWEDPRTGVSTIHRMDDGKDCHVCRYQATGYIRDIDGQIRTESDGFGYDLRDGSPQAVAMTPKELPKARQNIEQLTITKCKLRVLRGLLGIQTSFKLEELEKPFVVLKMQFNLDRMDPEIKKKLDTIMAAKQMGIEKELFGLMRVEAESVRNFSDSLAPQPGPRGLEVHPPLNLPTVSDPVIDDQERADEQAQLQYQQERSDQILRIDGLYQTKKGMPREKLSPDKPPLKELSDSDLTQIEDALLKLPDLKKDLI
jgi:hypothetical protein